MSRTEGIGAGTVMLAFLVGAVAGAAAALLYAPQSGEETRRLIGDKAREGRERAADAARKGRDVLQQKREQIVSAIERGREAYERARVEETV